MTSGHVSEFRSVRLLWRSPDKYLWLFPSHFCDCKTSAGCLQSASILALLVLLFFRQTGSGTVSSLPVSIRASLLPRISCSLWSLVLIPTIDGLLCSLAFQSHPSEKFLSPVLIFTKEGFGTILLQLLQAAILLLDISPSWVARLANMSFAVME